MLQFIKRCESCAKIIVVYLTRELFRPRYRTNSIKKM